MRLFVSRARPQQIVFLGFTCKPQYLQLDKISPYLVGITHKAVSNWGYR